MESNEQPITINIKRTDGSIHPLVTTGKSTVLLVKERLSAVSVSKALIAI